MVLPFPDFSKLLIVDRASIGRGRHAVVSVNDGLSLGFNQFRGQYT
jgi:hypothetical protein